MPAALEGVLVVAIEQAVAAPLCTLRLADGGARVIKLERLEGETARHYDQAVHGTSAYFAWLNRGKESVAFDLKSAESLALVERLLATADVFVQNLAPGAAARLGLDAAAIVQRHRRMIAVDIVGYGQDTDYRDMRAYDLLVQAESGLCAVTGTEAQPSKVGVSVADIATGMNAHALILEALIARQRSGVGQAIEVAMFDGMAEWMSVPLLHRQYADQATGRHGLSHASIYPYRPFPCIDGELVVSIQSPDEWRRFCSGVLRLPALVADIRFASNPARVLNRVALDALMLPVFAVETSTEMILRLEASQIAWGRVSMVDDLVAHPALRRLPVTLPGGEPCELPRPAGRSSFASGPVPALGEHTARVRTEFAA
jgi:crotonobetainyl-CoA:carnitine CoA-transferase CaiB-like acyl-CoA transferase